MTHHRHSASVPPTFVYDGDCSFCSSCARFIERRIPGPARVVAWQHVNLDTLGLSLEDVEAAVQWVTEPGQRSAGPEAIADLLRSSRPWWRALGSGLGSRAGLVLAWPAYRWVSRHRDRMPGGTAACALPQAERHAPHPAPDCADR